MCPGVTQAPPRPHSGDSCRQEEHPEHLLVWVVMMMMVMMPKKPSAQNQLRSEV